jgi:DNA-binding NtrC family response regulator
MPNSTILLLISDEQLSDLLERAVLKPAGYQVAQVKDPTAAKAIIRSSPIDAMVVEFGIGGDDFKIVKEFVSTYPGVPLIIISNIEDEALYIKALRLGVFEYLMPPLEPDVILDVAQRAVERRAKLNA